MRRNKNGPRVLIAVCANYPASDDKRDGNYHIEVSTSWDSFGDMLADKKGDPTSWEVDPDNLKEWLDAIKQARDKLYRLEVPKTRHYICLGSSYVYTGPWDYAMQSPGKKELTKWFEEYVESRWPLRCCSCGNRITDEKWYPFDWQEDEWACCSEYCAEREYMRQQELDEDKE